MHAQFAARFGFLADLVHSGKGIPSEHASCQTNFERIFMPHDHPIFLVSWILIRSICHSEHMSPD